jgi:hypothetical protein
MSVLCIRFEDKVLTVTQDFECNNGLHCAGYFAIFESSIEEQRRHVRTRGFEDGFNWNNAQLSFRQLLAP